jgi:transposase
MGWGAGAMSMSCDDARTSGVQRFEVFTGAGKRRDWSREVKAAIVAESYSGMETVSSVARRHGLCSSQLFTWRRQVREELKSKGIALPGEPTQVPMFVPAVIDQAPAPAPAPVKTSKVRRRGKAAAAVELEIDGVAVKIARGADATLIGAVIDALKTRA